MALTGNHVVNDDGHVADHNLLDSSKDDRLGIAPTVTASATCIVGKHNPFSATSTNLVATLPTGQPEGRRIIVEKNDSSGNSVTVSGNMRGTANSTIVMSLARETVELISDSAGSWWPVAGHKTLASLDARYAAASASVTNIDSLPLNVPATITWTGTAWPPRTSATSQTTRRVIYIGNPGGTAPTDMVANDLWTQG